MKYPIFVLFLSSLLLAFGVAEAAQNILIVSVDTLRADRVGVYGYQKGKTPAMDSLAKRGVIFKNTVSPTPFTLPSHISLMTGLIPPVHGVQDNGGFYLNNNIVTLAELLKAKGYKTGAFVGAFPLDSRFGLNQGFDFYDDGYPTTNNINEITMPERKADAVTDSTLGWLEKQKNSNWFAWVHYYDPHFPYQASEAFTKMFPENPYDAEVAFS